MVTAELDAAAQTQPPGGPPNPPPAPPVKPEAPVPPVSALPPVAANRRWTAVVVAELEVGTAALVSARTTRSPTFNPLTWTVWDPIAPTVTCLLVTTPPASTETVDRAPAVAPSRAETGTTIAFLTVFNTMPTEADDPEARDALVMATLTTTG